MLSFSFFRPPHSTNFINFYLETLEVGCQCSEFVPVGNFPWFYSSVLHRSSLIRLIHPLAQSPLHLPKTFLSACYCPFLKYVHWKPSLGFFIRPTVCRLSDIFPRFLLVSILHLLFSVFFLRLSSYLIDERRYILLSTILLAGPLYCSDVTTHSGYSFFIVDVFR